MSISTQTQQTMLSTEVAELTGKRHDHVIRDIEVIIEQLSHSPDLGSGFKSTTYLSSRGREERCYSLDHEATMVVVTGYDVTARAKVIKRWLDLEQAVKVTANLSLADAMAGVEIAARMLNMCQSSTLALASGVMKIKAPELAHLLPSYAIDAPTTSGSSLVTFAASTLLKENGSPMSTQKFNILSESKGFIVELERPSTTKGTKKFKSLTEKGLKFGKNLTSPQNPRETTPHYYSETFNELLEALC